MSKKIRTVEQLRRKYPTAKLIKDWDELKSIPKESKTHILEIDDCSGHLTCKNPRRFKREKSYSNQVIYLDHYLTTHTFYGLNFARSTKLLQKCGFNIIIDNWDKGSE